MSCHDTAQVKPLTLRSQPAAGAPTLNCSCKHLTTNQCKAVDEAEGQAEFDSSGQLFFFTVDYLIETNSDLSAGSMKTFEGNFTNRQSFIIHPDWTNLRVLLVSLLTLCT